MPRPRKGERTPGSGRAPGTPNKSTAEVRAAIAKFANDQAEDFVRWVNAVADGDEGRPADPGKAADLYLKAIEYHIPKLGRIEGAGDEGEHVLKIIHETK